jgi:DNA-binding CsgD family transcriptional regulator
MTAKSAHIITQVLSIYIDNTLFLMYNLGMIMQKNYPDYKKISELEEELQKIRHKLELTRYYNEKAYDKEQQLQNQLTKHVMGELVEVEGQVCKAQSCEGGPVYYPGRVHHIDGNQTNSSFGNLAMVCPNCRAHILLSRFSPKDIWLLKTRGLNNAQIGRFLGISRERVRQLFNKYEVKRKTEITPLLEANLDDLVKKAEYIENYLIESGRLRKRLDRRTKKKRILAELKNMAANKGDKK